MNSGITLELPAPVSTLAFGSSQDQLYIGADDGSIRLYELPSTKVTKAVRNLPEAVTAIAIESPKKKEEGVRRIWAASADQVHLFDFNTDKLVINPQDALVSLTLGADKEDVVNDLAISANGSTLAYVTDIGTVGTVDITTRRTSKMNSAHGNIAETIQWIPDRPGEIVSSGYDCTLFHFNSQQGNVLSKYSFAENAPAQDAAANMSFSPPFALCSAISTSAAMVVGTANGKLWVGLGGEKGTDSRAGKKVRKWNGLVGDAALELALVDGPVVGVTFISTSKIAACSLLGSLYHIEIARGEDGQGSIQKKEIVESTRLAKANALSSNEKWLGLGGFDHGGKGVVHVWDLSST